VIEDQAIALAHVKIRLIDVDGGGEAVADRFDQVRQIVKRRQLAGELGHRSPVAIGLPVENHLDQGLDTTLDRDQHPCDQKTRSKREEVSLQSQLLLEKALQENVHRGEGDHSEDEGDGVGQHLLDHHFDIPQLVAKNRNSEGQRDQGQRKNGEGRVSGTGAARHEGNQVQQQERNEPDRHPQVNPLDLLFLADGG
jgi:hypothetical protein